MQRANSSLLELQRLKLLWDTQTFSRPLHIPQTLLQSYNVTWCQLFPSRLLAQTCMELFFAWVVIRKAPLGLKHSPIAGCAKMKESMHRAAGRSKTLRPPSHNVAANQRPSGANAKSVAGTPQWKVRTTDLLFKSATGKLPSPKQTANKAPKDLIRLQLGPCLPFTNMICSKNSWLPKFQSFKQHSLGCEAIDTTCALLVTMRPQTRPWCARGGAAGAFAIAGLLGTCPTAQDWC